MSLENKQEEIEQYILGTLTGKERSEFEKKLSSDPEFVKKLRFTKN